MALTKCHECANPISTSAMTCPNCGAGRPFSRKMQVGAVVATVASLCFLLYKWDHRPVAINSDPRPQEALSEIIRREKAADKARLAQQQREAAATAERKRLEREKAAALEATRRREQDAAKTAEQAALQNEQREQRMVKQAERERQANAQQAALAEVRRQNRFRETLERAEYRPWITFGGNKASEAKISNYMNGVFTLTKRDGKTVEVRISRFGKADRAYVDKWLSDAQVSQ